MTQVRDSIEYRLAILEKDISILKIQQEEFKSIGREINNLITKTQMYDLSISDVKDKIEDHKVMMKSLERELKTDRAESLASQREMQKETSEKIDKIQQTLIKKLDEVSVATDTLRIQNIERQAADNSRRPSTVLNLSDTTLSNIVRLILAVMTIIAAAYGIKIL